jgi:hypothetical protein|tara:strand:- start:24 stop:377 length:354 start_codon:yes stop_codon:yes gene_type:complete
MAAEFMTESLVFIYGISSAVAIAAYLPQIWKLITATGHSHAFSINAWALWCATSAVSFLYAAIIVGDPMLLAVTAAYFGGNSIMLALIVYNRYIRFSRAPMAVVDLVTPATPNVVDI